MWVLGIRPFITEPERCETQGEVLIAKLQSAFALLLCARPWADIFGYLYQHIIQ